MADNVTADPGTGGAVFATDDIGGVHYPLNKLGFGALDSFTIVTASAGLPVAQQSGANFVVTNAGTFAVQVDAALPTGANTIGAVNIAAAQTLATVTTVTTVSTVTNLAQLGGATVPIGAGLEATAVRVTLPTDGTGKVLAAQSGTWNVTNVSGTISLPTGAATAANQTTGNSTLSTINGKITACNTGAVVISSGTITTVSTVTSVTSCTTLVGSSIAHDAIDSGSPHKIGAKAASTLSTKTLVAENDRTDLFAGTDGVLLTRSHCLTDVVQERATNTDGASTAFASGLAAPGAGIRLWIRNVTISNSSATFATVDLRDGAAGAVLWTLPVPATGGVTMHFDPPLKLTANTALAYDASAATTTISISANGFKSKI